MNRRAWIMALAVVVLVILYATGHLSNTWITVIGATIGFVMLAGSMENEMRYNTGQLISPTIRGSVDLDTKIVTDDGWCALPIGSIKSEAWNIFTKGGQGVVVFKRASKDSTILYKVGENALLLASPTPISALDLPGKVRDAIAGRRGFGPPYYLADKPLNPNPINLKPNWDVEAVKSENTALRRERNIYKDAFHGKTGMIDRELGRITGAARAMEIPKWKRWFRGRQDDEKPPSE